MEWGSRNRVEELCASLPSSAFSDVTWAPHIGHGGRIYSKENDKAAIRALPSTLLPEDWSTSTPLAELSHLQRGLFTLVLASRSLTYGTEGLHLWFPLHVRWVIISLCLVRFLLTTD